MILLAIVDSVSSSSERSNFTGVWLVNLEKSTLQGRPVKQLLMMIEHEEPRIVQKILVSYANGHEESLSFSFETTGEESTNSVRGVGGRTKAHWEGTELVIELLLQAGERELHFRDHWILSNDQQTLTMEHRGDDLAGQISVLEKAPPSAAARFYTTEK
jgi:hypothetical protein